MSLEEPANCTDHGPREPREQGSYFFNDLLLLSGSRLSNTLTFCPSTTVRRHRVHGMSKGGNRASDVKIVPENEGRRKHRPVIPKYLVHRGLAEF